PEPVPAPGVVACWAVKVEVGGLVIASEMVVCISLTVCGVCTIVPGQVEGVKVNSRALRDGERRERGFSRG
ncbi:MAG: hypothetical protein M3Q60_18740, partial [Actinomycetota bacterium]|nr:hypothetical protein [Actinomycetota bacterium]